MYSEDIVSPLNMPDSETHSHLHQRPPRLLIPIRVYFVLMNTVLLCLLFPTISYYFFHKTTTFRDTQLERAVADRTAALEARAAHLVQSLSHSGTQAISGYNFTFLNNLIREAVESDAELIGCQFIDEAELGAVTAGFGPEGIDLYEAFVGSGEQEKLKFAPSHTPGSPLPIVNISRQTFPWSGNYPVLQVVAPVYVGASLWGTVHAAFSLKLLQKDIENLKEEWAGQMRQYKISLLTITAIFFCLGVGSALLFTRPLIRTIYGLRDGVEQVAGGDLTQKIILNKIVACAEFVSLSRSFNHMTDNLRSSKRQLDEYSKSLEEKVEERTRELREAQAELVSQAHEAGMAEMAVGVLHNIGNAITPVKVTISMMSERLRKSALRTRIGEALKKFPAAIESAQNLSDQEKERLIRITELIPGTIEEEFKRALEDVESLRKKNIYIEEIIRLQMHYAKLEATKEQVDINRIAKDALKMLEDIIRRNSIVVETSFSKVPHVQVEESKLLQILLNLVKNACEAMTGSKNPEKKLTISTFQDDVDSSKVIISIKDTGCGFIQKDTNQLFTFGYSTKKRGSGFGLHSCANYLIANNGTIEARSDGPGHGAEFIIRLPVSTKAND
ncbi:MAG: GHKL domain-containing protein [Desulfobulbaceae bacterium]|nr:GHKL domain-containing protein [Desulfobulbaceae bacterium]